MENNNGIEMVQNRTSSNNNDGTVFTVTNHDTDHDSLNKNQNKFHLKIREFHDEHKKLINILIFILFNILAVIYFIFASIYEFNNSDECDTEACRAKWCRGYGTLLIIYVIFYATCFYYFLFKPYVAGFLIKLWKKVMEKHGKWIKIIFIGTFILTKVGIIAYLLISEISKDYTRLQSLLGILFVIVCGIIFSHNRSNVAWKTVARGLFLQALFGMMVLKQEIVRDIFDCMANRLLSFRLLSLTGATFVFGEFLINEQVFAFYVLSSVFFISFIVAILYHLGWIQNFISKIGQIAKYLTITTYIESTFAFTRLFLGTVGSFIIVQPFLGNLTQSELHAVLTSAFASAAGSTISIYTALGAQPIHLITANVMSASAALGLSKLIFPETKQTKLKGRDIKQYQQKSDSVLDAGTNGASEATKIYLHIIANIIAFIAFISFLNGILQFFTSLVGFENVTLEYLFELIFTPICWLIGIPWRDCRPVGKVIGIKLVDNEFVAYQELMKLLQAEVISPRAAAIATFVLSSFSNPTAIAIVVGTFIAIVPEKRQMMIKLLISAFITAIATSLMTASVAGFLMKSDLYEFKGNFTLMNFNQTKFNFHYL
uniref:CSON010092 protein n=1 Tax=Culicoides sonorensis TaxID=179676 RepID=A0A336K3M2_CULSO